MVALKVSFGQLKYASDSLTAESYAFDNLAAKLRGFFRLSLKIEMFAFYSLTYGGFAIFAVTVERLIPKSLAKFYLLHQHLTSLKENIK